MYTDNSRWSRLFVLLSLLSTGLSIVAAGLLFDYSSRLLTQSELFGSRSEGTAVVAGSNVVETDHTRLYTPGGFSHVRTFLPVRLQDNARRASLSTVENSILVDALRYKIAERVKVLQKRASPDLIVLEPAAPEVEIGGDVFHTVPRSTPVISGGSRKGRGG